MLILPWQGVRKTQLQHSRPMIAPWVSHTACLVARNVRESPGMEQRTNTTPSPTS